MSMMDLFSSLGKGPISMTNSANAPDAASLARDILAELLDQVRGHTIAVLEAANSSWLLWAPAGTSNHLLWHAGHALWVLDVLGVQLVTGRSELPAGWSEMFGMNCRPVNETKVWPCRREVIQRLTDQWLRLKEIVAQLPADQLGLRKTSHSDVVRQFVHGLHDEARHHGEMYLLFKMCRART